MRDLDVPVRQYKVLFAHVAERLGRLKPNGHLRSRSPLSNVVEIEGLGAVVAINVACWRTLREVADADPRLDLFRIRALMDRAQRQAETLADCRSQAVAEALLPVGGSATEAPAPEPPSTDAKADVEVPAHRDLPLPDYDHLPTGSLASRIRALDGDGIEELLAYERAHAHRLPVLLVLEHRREELAAGALPTSGDVTARRPGVD
jgi:hypothetical protein